LARAGYHVYALDFPGHGFASKTSEFEYGTPRFADVVTDFLDQIGGGPVTLAGTSLGAHVAAVVALRDPTRVKAAALIGAVGFVPTKGDMVKTAGKVSDTSTAGVRSKLEFLVFDAALVTDSWVIEESHINSSPGASEALARVRDYLEAIDDSLVGEEFAALGMPTILIWGAEDRWVPAEVGHRTANLMPEAPLVLLERAGHAPYYERPDAFNEVLIDYLSDPKGFPAGVQEV
jgi:pimeloyl-ACP methyl ester carboxylesterase